MARNFELTLSAPCFVGDNDAQLVAGDVAAGATNLIGRPAWSFDDAAEEAIVSCEFEVPSTYTGSGTLKVIVFCAMATATSGGVVWDIFVEAVTAGDTLDLEAAYSWDSANSGTTTAAGTAGDLFATTITLTNKDSMAAGDLIRIGVRRDTDNGSDTMSGDAYIFGISFFEEV